MEEPATYQVHYGYAPLKHEALLTVEPTPPMSATERVFIAMRSGLRKLGVLVAAIGALVVGSAGLLAVLGEAAPGLAILWGLLVGMVAFMAWD